MGWPDKGQYFEQCGLEKISGFVDKVFEQKEKLQKIESIYFSE